MQNFWSFPPIKESFVATLSETLGFTSRKYIPEQGRDVPNLLGTLKFLWSLFSVLALEKQPKIC